MSRRRVLPARISGFTVAVICLLLSGRATLAQSCPAACQPVGNGKQGPTTSTISIAFGTGFSAANIAAFQEGIEMWNTAFLQTWTDLWFSTSTYGPAQIIVVKDPSLSGTAVNDTDTNGNGTINVAADILNKSPDFLSHLLAHELGHSLGFGNNYDLNCATSTLMYGFISASGPFFSAIPSCDKTAVSSTYPTTNPTPPPQDELQHNGSPIILDLGNEGYRLTSVEDGVAFDVRSEGRLSQVAWTRRGAENAFLARDRDGNGTIDGGGELFGNFTVLRSGAVARHGFEALAELDDNQDGLVESADSAWSELVLWTDRNHDGRSTMDELLAITESAVTALEVDHQLVGRTDRFQNYFRYMSHFRLRRGAGEARRICFDVFLRIRD